MLQSDLRSVQFKPHKHWTSSQEKNSLQMTSTLEIGVRVPEKNFLYILRSTLARQISYTKHFWMLLHKLQFTSDFGPANNVTRCMGSDSCTFIHSQSLRCNKFLILARQSSLNYMVFRQLEFRQDRYVTVCTYLRRYVLNLFTFKHWGKRNAGTRGVSRLR